MSSRSWFLNLRSSIAPVKSKSRSASVDLPWSIWAMILKFRIFSLRMMSVDGLQDQSDDLVNGERGSVNDDGIMSFLERPDLSGHIPVIALIDLMDQFIRFNKGPLLMKFLLPASGTLGQIRVEVKFMQSIREDHRAGVPAFDHDRPPL